MRSSCCPVSVLRSVSLSEWTECALRGGIVRPRAAVWQHARRENAGFIHLLPDGSNTAVTEHDFLATHSSRGHQDHWSLATAPTPLAGEVSFPHKHVWRQALAHLNRHCTIQSSLSLLVRLVEQNWRVHQLLWARDPGPDASDNACLRLLLLYLRSPGSDTQHRRPAACARLVHRCEYCTLFSTRVVDLCRRARA